MSNPHHGTKVNDPSSVLRESAGPVASDSLAAESTRSGGGFSQNKSGEPLGVSGSNSTFANTNTSGATRLDPASDAEARMAQEDWAEERKLGAAGNTAYQSALGSENGGSKVDVAPSYVNSQFVDKSGPKGKNLTEGGFENQDYKNASFNGEIGGKNDPGRLAEAKMFRENADAGGDAGMPKQKGVGADNSFESLSGDTSA